MDVPLAYAGHVVLDYSTVPSWGYITLLTVKLLLLIN